MREEEMAEARTTLFFDCFAALTNGEGVGDKGSLAVPVVVPVAVEGGREPLLELGFEVEGIF